MTVQIELLKPKELNEARDRFPVAYVPVGAIEFHGYHLPVGLDTLKAHRLLCRVAEADGGLVAPPIFYGTGGGHTEFAWTWMLEPEVLQQVLLTTIHGLEKSGFQVIVILSGHYPNDQLYPALQKAYQAEGGKAKLLTLMEYDPFREAGEAHGDHAAKWESSYMLALGPDLVDMSRVQADATGQPVDTFPLPKPGTIGSWWFEKDPAHPWFGIAAAEDNSPLDASAEAGEMAIERVMGWIRQQVLNVLSQPKT